MMKIILACAVGMSTSLLVNKMNEAAESGNIEASIKAIPEAVISEHLDECDVILLGPQVKFMIDEIRAIAAPKNIPVEIVPMQLYGMMNGKAVLELALSLKGGN
ncbi:PTS sugar transporter subunit IIB [Clostridium sp.]|uniref:PTS sugar transporter subunit IIB n=1 Tax=Clostridium sp. TaxID=1506 RepID=UPI0025BCB065|nr:PTS sugar transporter subunit IIB [Clostridium sp.]